MSKSKEKASASTIERLHDSDDDYVLRILSNSGVYDNRCMLDSGCTLHMIFRRDWSSDYETNGGTITMGNSVTCKRIDIGSIWVCCLDGIMRTIIKVCHVLDLKNLGCFG